MNWKLKLGLGAAIAIGCAVVLAYDGVRREAKAGGGLMPTPTAATAMKSKSTKEAVIADLMAIIQETESTDTFLITLQTLLTQNPKDMSVLPIAIRKAEKLGLLDGAATNPKPEQEAFLDVLDQITSGGRPRGATGTCTPGCSPAALPVAPACAPSVPPPPGELLTPSFRRGPGKPRPVAPDAEPDPRLIPPAGPPVPPGE